MKQLNFIRSAISMMALIILGVSLSLAQSSRAQDNQSTVGASTTAAATSPWFIDVIDGDASTDVGQYVSVAIDPRNDRSYISYYDATNGDLRVAKYVESGGNCGPDGSWSCETVDSTGDVGKFTSIAVYTGTYPFMWKLGVSYYDVDNYALKYAQYAWSQPLQSHQWTTYTIHSGSVVNKYGLHTSLKFDPTGTPLISYHRSAPPSPGNDALMYAERVGSGGNCGPSSNWQCDVIDTGSGVGQYASLSLYGSGSPEIAYYDSGNDRLKRAIHSGGSGAGCNPDNDEWICNVIDTAGGKYTAADRDSKGHRLHIAYYDEINGELESAQYWGASGNCGPGDSWWCSRIDTIGTSSDPMGISLVIEDRYDFPFFAYQDIPGSPDTASLKVAGYNELGVIDPGGICTDEATFVSVDASPSGLIVIAYYESNTCYDSGRLKVAHYPFREVFLPLVLRDDD